MSPTIAPCTTSVRGLVATQTWGHFMIVDAILLQPSLRTSLHLISRHLTPR